MPASPAQLSAPAFDRLYGLELLEIGETRAAGSVVVRDELTRGSGHVHGGVYAAIAETLTSMATARAVAPQHKLAAALSSQTSFVRPIASGSVHAVALARHRGRTTWVWEVTMTDDQGRLCVLTRMTVAVTDAPPG